MVVVNADARIGGTYVSNTLLGPFEKALYQLCPLPQDSRRPRRGGERVAV